MPTKKTVKKTTKKPIKKRQKQDIKLDKRVIAVAVLLIVNVVGFQTGGIFIAVAILIDLIAGYLVYRKYLKKRFNLRF